MLKVNGVEIKEVICNGKNLDKVTCNGAVVFEKNQEKKLQEITLQVINGDYAYIFIECATNQKTWEVWSEDGEKIKTVKGSGNTAYKTKRYSEYIKIKGDDIVKLQFTKNVISLHINYCSILQNIEGYNSKLKKVEISRCKDLKMVNFSPSSLREYYVSECDNLEYVFVASCDLHYNVVFSGRSLKQIMVFKNHLSSNAIYDILRFLPQVQSGTSYLILYDVYSEGNDRSYDCRWKCREEAFAAMRRGWRITDNMWNDVSWG